VSFARVPTLVLAAVLDSPALWHAFVLHDLDYTVALTRYLIAVVVAALMLWILRWLTDGYLHRDGTQKTGAGSGAGAGGTPLTPGQRIGDSDRGGEAGK